MKKVPTKITLLLAATMTIMAGAIVAPSLHNISRVFAERSGYPAELSFGCHHWRWDFFSQLSLLYLTVSYHKSPGFFAFAYLLIGIGYGLVSLANRLVLVIAGLVVSGLNIGLLIPNTNIWLLSALPEQIRGFGTGIKGTFLIIEQFVSPIAIRPLVEAYSLSAAFGLAIIPAAVLSLVFTVLHLRREKKKHQVA